MFVSLVIYTNGLSAERSSWNYDILFKKSDLLCITLRNEKSRHRREVNRLRRQNFESEVITKPHTRVNAVCKTSFRSDGITLFFPSSRLVTYLWSRRVNILSYLCPPTFCVTQLSHLYTPQTISHSVMWYTLSSISRSVMSYTSLFIWRSFVCYICHRVFINLLYIIFHNLFNELLCVLYFINYLTVCYVFQFIIY